MNGSELAAHSLASLSSEGGIAITARQDALVALIGGESVGSRFMEWNFVSSRKERIAQAREDWQNGAFPVVPGDEKEWISLPG